MDTNSLPINLTQPALFDFAETTTGAMELFPAVWSAVEDLAAPETRVRHSALHRLEALNAPRLSPLVTYMLATRLTDPDLGLRLKIIQILGNLFLPDEHGQPASEISLRYLSGYLGQMRTRAVYDLLEAAASNNIEQQVARLLNASPYAANHLVDIMADRKNPLDVRRQAIHFIGLVGFLDALPALERLEVRLAARLSGQQSMPFAPPSSTDETALLPVVQKALALLKAP